MWYTELFIARYALFAVLLLSFGRVKTVFSVLLDFSIEYLFFACDTWLFVVYVLLFTDFPITDLSHYMDDIVFFDIWYSLILIKYLIFLNQPDYYSANLPQCLQIFFHSKKLFLFLCSVQLLFFFLNEMFLIFPSQKSATKSAAI